MTTAGRCVPMLAMLMAGVIGGAAASLLLGGGSVVLADEQASAAVMTKAIHLADKDGNVRAIIKIGQDGDPEVSLLNKKGKVTEREKLIPPQEPGLIAGVGEQFRILLDKGETHILGPPEGISDHDCLVAHPRIGFAVTGCEASTRD